MQKYFSQLCIFSLCALHLHLTNLSRYFDGFFGETNMQLAEDQSTLHALHAHIHIPDNNNNDMLIGASDIISSSKVPFSKHIDGVIEERKGQLVDDRATFKSGNQGEAVVSKPVPVILMSLGRSGSSAIFDTMSALAGKRLVGTEYVGSDTKSSKKFFLEHTDGNWLRILMKGLQEKHPTSRMVGFKWKPHYDSMRLPGARVALEAAARENIRVVYSQRNPLDVAISRFKHRNYTTVKAHCKVGDTICIAKHKRHRIQLPVGKSLIAQLNDQETAHREAQHLLQATGVSYMNTTYEQLFFDDPDRSLEAWLEIMRFIGVTESSAASTTTTLTIEDIRAASGTAYTGVPSHEKSLSNYKQVRDELAGTQFESLLH